MPYASYANISKVIAGLVQKLYTKFPFLFFKNFRGMFVQITFSLVMLVKLACLIYFFCSSVVTPYF
uniref:Uncharacterized protein n=1 Tax=Arundo donax TaxID=35708 RepID=A0A0A9H4M8_ARUDO